MNMVLQLQSSGAENQATFLLAEGKNHLQTKVVPYTSYVSIVYTNKTTEVDIGNCRLCFDDISKTFVKINLAPS